MKLLGLTLGLIISASAAVSDVLKIETNNWDLRRELIWTAKLSTLDRDTGIATFVYSNKGETSEILVHFSRIYSITFDNDQTVNKPFPKTRADLTTPLGSIPRSRERILLENDGFLDIPNGVRIVPDRNAEMYTLKGGIVSLAAEELNIEASVGQGEETTFTVPQAAFINWIRGK